MRFIIASTVALLFSASVYAQNAEVESNFSAGQVGAAAAAQANGGQANGYGYGGNSEVGNGFGNFSPSASAIGHQDQGQLQHQGQGQFQGNVGVGSGNDTQISFGEQKIEAEPAIAPGIAPPDPTAPCIATYGASGAGGGVVSLGFSAYEYDEVCGALEFYRVVGKDPAHKAQADKAVGLAYAMLLDKIKSEMGPTKWEEATGSNTPAEGGTTASYQYPTQDGGMMKVSFSPYPMMDAPKEKTARNVTQSIRD
jgi:hypothetical protein